ncbi:MAG TPA: hypothetical protein VJW73_01265 [Gemmatimonadaceae bacterium]|nr:hypothetical protein [Gemmatimonadaceae bacterium]
MSAPSVVTAVPAAAPRVESAARYVARWLPWITAAVALLAAINAIEPLPIGVFYDDAQYLVLAKALATGEGYRFINLPGAPLATHFPPGYPAFLALLWRLAPGFPENVALFKFANALLLAAVAAFTGELARRTLGLSRGLATAAALAGTVTIPSLVLSSAVMSEPLFLALLVPLLIWAERVAAEVDASTPLRRAVMLGAAIAVVALIRTHGLALAGAVVLTYLGRRRHREAAACAATIIIGVAPWMLWVASHNDALPPLVRGAYGSYTAWLAAGWHSWGMQLLVVTVPDNIATIGMSVVRSIVPKRSAGIDVLVGGAFALLTAIGITVAWRKMRVTTLFVAGYLAIVLVWPFSPLRFVWGIWPLLMLFPAAGLAAAWSSVLVRQSRPARAGVVVLAASLALGIAAFNVQGYANAWWSSNARFHARRVLPQLAWVAKATSPNDVIASDAEAAVYLYTGRRTAPVATFTAGEYVRERTVAEETAVMSSLLESYRPRYVLVTSQKLVEATARLARQAPASLARVDSLDRGVVYSFRR